MILPTILSQQPLTFSNIIECHPSGNICMLNKQGVFCPEIIVGEIIVKSPYEA